jgi:hypothetical protein
VLISYVRNADSVRTVCTVCTVWLSVISHSVMTAYCAGLCQKTNKTAQHSTAQQSTVQKSGLHYRCYWRETLPSLTPPQLCRFRDKPLQTVAWNRSNSTAERSAVKNDVIDTVEFERRGEERSTRGVIMHRQYSMVQDSTPLCSAVQLSTVQQCLRAHIIGNMDICSSLYQRLSDFILIGYCWYE